MDNFENTARPSGLRPPTHISQLSGAGLQEISDSQNNARANNPAAAAPPPHQGHKRQNTGNFGLSQPEPKRKTLVERAEEPIGGAKSQLPGLSRSASFRGATIPALVANNKASTSMVAPPRQTSSSTSSSSRPPSTSSFASSMGPTSRPLSSIGRPPTSSSNFSQSGHGRQRSTTKTRPATAMSSHGTGGAEGKQQQNSTKLPMVLHRSRSGRLQNRKVRGHASTQSMDARYQRESKRDISITAQFSKLSIRDAADVALFRGQVNSAQQRQQETQQEAAAEEEEEGEKEKAQQDRDNHGNDGPSSHPFQSGVQRDNNVAAVVARQGKKEDEVARPTIFCSTESSLSRSTMRARPEAGTGVVMGMGMMGTWTGTEPPRTPARITEAAARETIENLERSIQLAPWDIDERLHGIESQFRVMKEAMDGTLTDRKALEEAVDLAKTRAGDLERERARLDERNAALERDLDAMRQQFAAQTLSLEAAQRAHRYELEDAARAHRHEVDELRRALHDEAERTRRDHAEALDALTRHHRAELDDERAARARETHEMQARLGAEQQDTSLALLGKDRELQGVRGELEEARAELAREKALRDALQRQAGEAAAANVALEERGRALRAQVEFLESDSKQQSDSFASMEARLQEALRQAEAARQKLIKEETERRVLFNKYQELKGNIRVMCRVRPVLQAGTGSAAGAETEGDAARLAFPDNEGSSTQIDVTGPEEKSSLGNVTRKVTPFEFDRVFPPATRNDEVFDEIAQLVQSALDGYNVCIFAYGQTGSGKTYTMSSEDGMIRRATHMIYDTVARLREKSWEYTMEGSFVEVYNEELHDLLSPSASQSSSSSESNSNNNANTARKKLEIRHDEARRQTTVTGCRVVPLDSPDTVQTMLAQAQRNRSVAATRSNERSSRSHSVFMLRLSGANAATGARCEGTLNLVDLAGSERLKQSGAEGERMRETQSINRSLACLGDVIEALGRAGAVSGNGSNGAGGGGGGQTHIPYRNSKLTHLLQYSLGGNSKTLMFVMVSPLEAHLRETLTSLRFATKVHNTHIGTARATKKIKDKERASEP